MKEALFDYIEKNVQPYIEMSSEIFDNPEQGLILPKAQRLLTDWLKNHGYAVTCPEGGLESAFKGIYENGTGGPSIGLLCEYDALPIGHACGHHMQAPIMFLAAEAIRAELKDKPYKLVIYGTPGEEGYQGKTKMIVGGSFKDIDVSLMTHASPNTTVDIKSLAGSKWEIIYTGVAAHESLTPELVRSALDGILVCFNGMEFLKGHVKEDVKFYCSINECAGMDGYKNTTQAKCTIAVRTYHSPDLPAIEERMQNVWKGAAMITGTTVEYQKVSSTVGKIPSLSLNEVIMKNAELINAPAILAYRDRTGSTDFADVTQMLPGAVSRYSLVPEGSTSHSQAFLDYGKGEKAENALKLGAKIIAASTYDLISDENILMRVKEEYINRKADEQKQLLNNK